MVISILQIVTLLLGHGVSGSSVSLLLSNQVIPETIYYIIYFILCVEVPHAEPNGASSIKRANCPMG